MELTYEFDKNRIELSEAPNELDIEFELRILLEKDWTVMKQVQKYFEENKIYTDVLFYPHENHHYKVIVRRDYYPDFVLKLMRHQLLLSVNWNE